MGLDVSELLSYAAKYLRERVPGLYELVNLLCLKRYGRKLSELLLSDPPKVYEVLLEHYRDEYTAAFVFTVLLRPILIKLKMLDRESEVVEVAKRSAEKFKEILNLFNP